MAYGDSATLGAAPLLTCHGDTIFSPDVTQVLKAGKTAAFEDGQGSGVVTYNGRMVENLHVESARRTLSIHDAIRALATG